MEKQGEYAPAIQAIKTHIEKDYKEFKLHIYKDIETLKRDYATLMKDYETLKKDNANLIKDNETLKQAVDEIQKIPKGMYINGNNNNNTSHYHIHLDLAKYGTESYPDDTKALTDAIKGVNKAIPSLVKLRHFDPRHPENQNIKIPNKKHNKIQIYDGTRWITEDKRMTIEDKLQEYTNFMDTDEGQEIYNSCSIMIKEKLDRLTNFCDKVHSGDKLNREEQRELKRIRGDVENIILDHQKK
jgi:hypothetical protein